MTKSHKEKLCVICNGHISGEGSEKYKVCFPCANEFSSIGVVYRRRITKLEKERDGLAEKVCDNCDGTGWVENIVEGKAVCGCMYELEPYAILLDENTTLRAENERLKKPITPEIIERAMKWAGENSSSDPEYYKRLSDKLNELREGK